MESKYETGKPVSCNGENDYFLYFLFTVLVPVFKYILSFSLPIRKGHSAVISHVVLNIVKLQNCPEITNNSLVLADIMAIIMSWLLLLLVVLWGVGLIVNHFY